MRSMPHVVIARRPSGRATRLAAAALTVLLVVAAAPTRPAAEELPAGKFGLNLGVRQGLGRLSDQFGVGGVWGFDAAYQPTSLERSWSFGVTWSVLWSWFGPNDLASISGALSVLEMSGGLKLRRMMGEGVPRFLAPSIGITALRTNVPIAPDGERVYLGPYAAVAVENYLLGQYLLSIEARYGLVVSGPSSLSIILGIGFGN